MKTKLLRQFALPLQQVTEKFRSQGLRQIYLMISLPVPLKECMHVFNIKTLLLALLQMMRHILWIVTQYG